MPVHHQDGTAAHSGLFAAKLAITADYPTFEVLRMA
jgi:hypothetical protein